MWLKILDRKMEPRITCCGLGLGEAVKDWGMCSGLGLSSGLVLSLCVTLGILFHIAGCRFQPL